MSKGVGNCSSTKMSAVWLVECSFPTVTKSLKEAIATTRYVNTDITVTRSLRLSQQQDMLGGTGSFFPKIVYIFCDHHNFFPLSSVQIIIIPACCLLCVL